MGKHRALRSLGLVMALLCLIEARSSWAQSAASAEIQPPRQPRPVRVAAATRTDRRIRTPRLII
ncbi:MAG: hypothetical protein ACE5I9_12220, partial [Candidatus Methylomirabilales bacterium]